jgi:hypothetical protein
MVIPSCKPHKSARVSAFTRASCRRGPEREPPAQPGVWRQAISARRTISVTEAAIRSAPAPGTTAAEAVHVIVVAGRALNEVAHRAQGYFGSSASNPRV